MVSGIDFARNVNIGFLFNFRDCNNATLYRVLLWQK